MCVSVKFVCTTVVLLSFFAVLSRSRKVFNSCHFNAFPKFYISETVYFDLSRFALEEDFWTVPYEHENYTVSKLRFTFCRNMIISLGENDEPYLAAIYSDDVNVVKNAGTRVSGPHYVNNELEISLVNGEDCGDIKFSVLVRLNCSYQEEKPRFADYHDCHVLVIWNTPVACPINETDTRKTCVIKSAKGVTYDLRPLRHTVYHYDHRRTGHYRVNVCGKKKASECNTVCEYDNVIEEEIEEHGSFGELALGGHDSSILEIRYMDHSNDICAEVLFKCDRFGHSHVTRMSVIGHIRAYMNSIFACESKLPNTVFQDSSKNSYNISDLYYNAHNYKVKGPTEDLIYIFNLGGTVDHMPGIACEGAVCMWDSFNNMSVSLGHAQLEPLTNEEYITLRFTGGDKCGTGLHVHSAVIKLVCKPNETDPELEFITHDCTHYIMWETISACSYQYFRGVQCSVSEETYSHYYDLKPLRNKTSNYVVVSPMNEKFYVSICGSIIGSCGTHQSHVSVCWKNKAIGFFNDEPIYYNGGIELKMTGEPCRSSGPNSTVIIQFLCEMNPDAADHNQLLFKRKDEFSCIFIFVMYTSTVCTSPMKKYMCDVTDHQGHEYNFKRLSKTNSNYVVKATLTTLTNNVTFLLNICQPVINGPDVMCPHDAMACMFVNPIDNNNRYMSLGKMGETGSFKINKKNHLELHYVDGVPCVDETAPVTSYSMGTVIEFICDHTSENSLPVFVDLYQCQYRFTWRTPVACPLDSEESTTPSTTTTHEAVREHNMPNHFLKTEENNNNKPPLELSFSPEKRKVQEVGSEKETLDSSYTYEESPGHSVDYISDSEGVRPMLDCAVVSEHGERIDLSPLVKKDWHVRMNSYKSLVYSVCRNLSVAKCNSNRRAGACMTNIHTGVANNKLMYAPGNINVPGKVTLHYIGGDKCHKGNHRYSTFLEFVCGEQEESPMFVQITDDCIVEIRFVTPLVCVFDCVANSINMKKRIDMSMFKANTHNYHVRSGDYEFIINVCRPLVIMDHKSVWPDGSAACKMLQRDGVLHSCVSLGVVSPPMVIDKDGSVLLHYVRGSRCPKNINMFVSTTIRFVCSLTVGFGRPEFRKVVDECEYYFNWYTAVVCPNRTDVFDSDACVIHDANHTSMMDLVDFKESRHEVKSLAGRRYMLELCRSTMKICNYSHICRMSGNAFIGYGDKPIITYDYSRNAVHMLYVGGQCTKIARYHASIWLKCNQDNSWPSPVIITETDCIVVFQWETSHFCYRPNVSTAALIVTDKAITKKSSTTQITTQATATTQIIAVTARQTSKSGSGGLILIIVGFMTCMVAFGFGLWVMDRRNSRFSDILTHYYASSPQTTSIRYSRDPEESSSML